MNFFGSYIFKKLIVFLDTILIVVWYAAIAHRVYMMRKSFST